MAEGSPPPVSAAASVPLRLGYKALSFGSPAVKFGPLARGLRASRKAGANVFDGNVLIKFPLKFCQNGLCRWATGGYPT